MVALLFLMITVLALVLEQGQRWMNSLQINLSKPWFYRQDRLLFSGIDTKRLSGDLHRDSVPRAGDPVLRVNIDQFGLVTQHFLLG